MRLRQSAYDALMDARDLVSSAALDAAAVMVFLDGLEPWLVDALQSDISAAQKAVIAVPLGDERHEVVARYYIARIVMRLERMVAAATAG